QQRRDQEAADHEEDIDAKKAAREEADVAVIDEDRDHRDRAQSVEAAEPASPWHSPAPVESRRLALGGGAGQVGVLVRSAGGWRERSKVRVSAKARARRRDPQSDVSKCGEPRPFLPDAAADSG